MTVLRLGLQSGLKSKFIAYMLILFNSVSFSYYSYQIYCSKIDKINEAKIYNANLDQRRNTVELEIKELKAELGKMNSVYRESLSKGYISSSSKSIIPRITKLENELTKKSDNLKSIRITSYESEYVVLLTTIFVIVLKIILQLSSIYLIRLDLQT